MTGLGVPSPEAHRWLDSKDLACRSEAGCEMFQGMTGGRAA
jgi:hypothetical protein